MEEIVSALAGRERSRVIVDAYGPPLVLLFLVDEGPPQRIEVNAAFVFMVDGAATRLDPAGDRSELAPVLRVVGRTIRESALRPDGGLYLAFDGVCSIDVDGTGVEPWWIDTEYPRFDR